jgi:type IV fimbrial biogenesis protein FimT
MTLIEVIISMAVLALIMALGAPSLFEWTQNLQIRAAADAMLNGIQLAKSEAIKRNLNVQILLVPPAAGWTVSEAASGTAIQARSAAEGSPNAQATVTPAGATTLTFAPMGGVTSNADASASITQIDVSNVLAPPSARNLRIVVTGGGSVRMCDPALTSPDPRAC